MSEIVKFFQNACPQAFGCDNFSHLLPVSLCNKHSVLFCICSSVLSHVEILSYVVHAFTLHICLCIHKILFTCCYSIFSAVKERSLSSFLFLFLIFSVTFYSHLF